jgi:hypothetical protein
MIAIVRLQASESVEELWEHILSNVNWWRKELENRGLPLYLTRRSGYDDVSLFIHVVEPDDLGNFINTYIGRSPGVSGVWLVNLLNPVFFPLPRDTRGMHRYAISVRTTPNNLVRARDEICCLREPLGVRMAYCGFTYLNYEESLYYSVLAENDTQLGDHIDRVLELDTVLRARPQAIERTVPLVSYSKWVEYSAEHLLVPSWDEAAMLGQFQT